MPSQPTTRSDVLERAWSVFGSPDDSMEELEARADRLLADVPLIVWQGDAATFEFSHVSASAETLLGHPVSRWTLEPTFWAETVVHPDDRADAIAFCAVATGQCRDHDFLYRAVAADGSIVWLHDIVRVIVGPRGVPTALRGIMLDVTADVAGTEAPGS
jgi:PAS domain-containing protein